MIAGIKALNIVQWNALLNAVRHDISIEKRRTSEKNRVPL
jgi:hypothetical protein